MMSIGLMDANPAAIRSCAPYGISPCVKQENVSRILALLRLSTPYFPAMSWANGPAVMMATVLLAVHKLITLTNAAMLNSAPRLERICRVSACRI